MKISGIVIGFMTLAAPVWAAPYESQIKSIDKSVIAIDKNLPNYTWTSAEDCEGHGCVTMVAYWEEGGKIKKVVEIAASDDRPGSITGRYYANCQMILSRVAPANAEATKNPMNIEKYYFNKGKLLRIVIGGSMKTYSKEQTAYYERTQHVAPPSCEQK